MCGGQRSTFWCQSSLAILFQTVLTIITLVIIIIRMTSHRLSWLASGESPVCYPALQGNTGIAGGCAADTCFAQFWGLNEVCQAAVASALPSKPFPQPPWCDCVVSVAHCHGLSQEVHSRDTSLRMGRRKGLEN